MGDWNLLGSILEEVHIHSTIVGKIWLTILFIFRMLVLGVAAEDVWDDEQSEFICNTEQPGCSNICYDKAFPISLIRYWVLQVIFVSSPSLVYMGHALYRLRALEKERQKRKAHLRAQLEDLEPMPEEHRRVERELRKLEEQKKVNKAPLRGSLLRTYVLHILTRSVVEVGFMIGQYLLYGFHMPPLYKCTRPPCPNTVDCFVSRPTEKTIFMLFMHSIAAVSLFLNILEIAHLGLNKIHKTLAGQPRRPAGRADDEAGPCHPTNSSAMPPRPSTSPPPPPSSSSAAAGGLQRRGEPGAAAPPRRRPPGSVQHRGQRPPASSSSEEAPPGTAGTAGPGPGMSRRLPRKHSRVSACRDVEEDRGESPDSGHCPGTRKSSFLSRVLPVSPEGSGNQSAASPGGSATGSGAGSPSGCEGQRSQEGSPAGSPPPPAAATGRRVSMASSAPLPVGQMVVGDWGNRGDRGDLEARGDQSRGGADEAGVWEASPSSLAQPRHGGSRWVTGPQHISPLVLCEPKHCQGIPEGLQDSQSITKASPRVSRSPELGSVTLITSPWGCHPSLGQLRPS
ncbi:gap junction alpha-10 protein [Oxyura jamaicensis]|uniref:gap junction alpha-10 protein n=1 Tax=Oxyura jamaicensis TaxID=8884 RepID=UPI0015A67636|nr:gap junction alpha-10 protein [Oxyura jamaicensis]